VKCREARVGFAIKHQLLYIIESLLRIINDRLMTIQIPLKRGRIATLLNDYGPRISNIVEVKDTFYKDLDYNSKGT
jgi:hypothetical protein